MSINKRPIHYLIVGLTEMKRIGDIGEQKNPHTLDSLVTVNLNIMSFAEKAHLSQESMYA